MVKVPELLLPLPLTPCKVKVVEVGRVAEKQPHFERCKAIDAAAAYVSELPEAALEHLKTQKKDYILKVEAEKKRKEAEQEQMEWAVGIVVIVMLLGAIGWGLNEMAELCAKTRCGK